MKKTPDKPQGRDALIFALKVMDDYSFPIGVLAEVLGLSESTIRRHRERLVRRPVRAAQPDEVATAKKIVMIRMLKEGFSVADIVATVGVGKDTVYRQANHLVATLAQYPAWYQRLYAGMLVNSNPPMPVRRWNAQRRSRRWRTGSNR